jgi:hypothetical protein
MIDFISLFKALSNIGNIYGICESQGDNNINIGTRPMQVGKIAQKILINNNL